MDHFGKYAPTAAGLCRNGAGSGSQGLRPHLYTAAAILACYALYTFVFPAGEEAVRVLMLAVVGLCGVYAFRERSNFELVISAIIVAGIVMRTGYMLYTPFTLRGHDVGSLWDNGHYSYMYNLFLKGTLPQTNDYQYYQPPFEHMVQTFFVKVFAIFQPADTHPDRLFEASKVVPCFASCALLWISRSICNACRVPKQAAAVAIAIIAFSPAFYILSASVNNDPLMLMFFLLAVLFTIRWYYDPSMQNILLIALSIGLGMMTKLSCGLAALFTGVVFLIVMMQRLRQKRGRAGLFMQFAAFLLVCLPLGLWHPCRQAFKFGQPLGYVFKIGQDSALYSGDKSIIDRFFSFPADQLLNPLYCRPYGDYNIPLYTLKSSVFGEYAYSQIPALASALVIANLVLIAFSFVSMIYVMARCRETNRFIRFGLFFIWIVQIVSFVVFNLQYPFGCTMDFRYIIPTAVTGAVYTGVALHHINKKQTAVSRVVFTAGIAAVCFFIAASVLFYALPVSQ